MPFWHRLVIVAVVLLATALVARLIDRRIARRDLAPGTATRYRVLRRSITTAVIMVGLLSALLVIPQVRAVAGGLLASTAVLGVIIGLASQQTLGNFIAGLLIATTQPVRIGDRVTYDGESGVVEEIGLTYTFIRISDNDRLVIPNEKIASDTIRNSSIRSRKRLAQVTVPVPLDRDLDTVIGLLREVAGADDAQVQVTDLDESAHLALSVWADDDPAAERLESDLRLKAHARLREAGVFA